MVTRFQFILMSLFSLAAALPASADGDGIHRFWIEKTFQNQSKIKHYQAAVEQRYNQQVEQLEVYFRPPAEVAVLNRAADGATQPLLMLQQQTLRLATDANYRLAIAGLDGLTQRDHLQAVEDQYWFNQQHFERTFTPSEKVAGRIAVGVELQAQDSDLALQHAALFVDYHYSLPVKGQFRYRDGSELALANQYTRVNQPEFEFPVWPEALSASRQWDFRLPGVTQSQAESRLGSPLRQPALTDGPWQMPAGRYFAGPAGQAAAYFYNDQYSLALIAERALSLSSVGRPLTLPSGVKAQLLQAPLLTLVEFVQDGVNYRLLSDIHPEVLLAAAEKMTQ